MKGHLAVLAAGNFVIGTGAFLVAGVLPHMAADLEVTIPAIGQLVTVYALTYAVASPILITFASLRKRRPALAAALLLYALGNLLAAVAGSVTLLFVARIVAALGAALFTPLAAVLAAELSPPERRARALSLVFVGFTLANVAGVPFGTMLGNNIGWRWAFASLAALGAAVAGILLALLPLTRGIGARTLAAVGNALRRPLVLSALGVALLQFAAQFVVYTYIAAILRSGGVFGDFGVFSILLLLGGATIIGNLLGGWASDRWGPGRVITVVLLLLVPALALFPLASHSVVLAGVDAVAWGMVGTAFQVPQQHRMMSIPGEAAPVMLALNASALYLGMAGGAALGGIVVRRVGLHPLGVTGAALALLAILFTSTIRIPSRPVAAKPS
jgi:DHA1 family inner membrane transport protein